jgi:hypothetical protein
LVWISNPYRGKVPDVTIIRNELLPMLGPNLLCVVDGGIRGEDAFSGINPFDSPAIKKFKKRARARHETANGKIKKFRSVSSVFRHGPSKHCLVFDAVAVVCQFKIETGEVLFEL